MLAALGMFVFETASAPFEELSRRRAWRHERTKRFGARDAGQYVGPGEDQVTISGAIVPGITGGYSAIEQLAAMAETGEAWPLSDGTGTVFGHFTIDALDEGHKYLSENGKARRIDFTLTLTRTGDV